MLQFFWPLRYLRPVVAAVVVGVVAVVAAGSVTGVPWLTKRHASPVEPSIAVDAVDVIAVGPAVVVVAVAAAVPVFPGAEA